MRYYDYNNTIFKWNPRYYAKSKLYKINDLAFQGQYSLKTSDLLSEILMPTDTMNDQKNPKSDYLWARYRQSAIYTNYPNRYLNQAIGMATKEKYTLQVPKSMQSIDDYATLQNTTLQDVYNEVIQSIIKYGNVLIITNIMDQVDTANTTPKMEVIPGCDVLDGQRYFDRQKNLDVFKRIVYYKQEYIFNPHANTYTKPQIYVYVKGLDQNGRYYQAKMKQQFYGKFNLFEPILSKNIVQSLSYPEWTGPINMVPCVFANKDNLKLFWKQSPIQNLIDTSLAIFQLTADMRFLMHQQSSSTLVIAGTDMEGKSIRTGLGNVLNLTDSGSNANWISPSVAGLQAMQSELNTLHLSAQNQLLNIEGAGASSSSDALALRVKDKARELITIVNQCGKAVQRELQLIAQIMNENPDQVVFSPYIGFGQDDPEYEEERQENTEDTVITKKQDKNQE